MKRILVIATVLAAATVTIPALHAGTPNKKKYLPVMHQPLMHTTISRISPTSITVKEAKESKTFAITSFTDIGYNGSPAKITDLHPGMRVEITAGSDPSTAARINASEAPKATPKPGGKKKK
jgi:hypothetical protein